MPMLAIKAPEQMWGTQDRVAGGKVGEEELGQPLGHPHSGHDVLRPSEAFCSPWSPNLLRQLVPPFLMARGLSSFPMLGDSLSRSSTRSCGLHL